MQVYCIILDKISGDMENVNYKSGKIPPYSTPLLSTTTAAVQVLTAAYTIKYIKQVSHFFFHFKNNFISFKLRTGEAG